MEIMFQKLAVRERRAGKASEDLAEMRRQKATQAEPLPPDPESMNENRTKWANAAIVEFIMQTGTDGENALADLFADLMHWADRHGLDFDTELECGRMHYSAETTEGPDPTPIEQDRLPADEN